MSYYVFESKPNNGYYLEHHGIKGQHWGVRRFQNEDGSLTAAGERRYSIDSANKATKSLNRIEKENAKLMTKRAITEIKAEKAFQKGNDKKYKKFKDAAKDYDDAIESGKRLTKKLVSDARKTGYTVNSIDKTRYTHTGRQVVANLIAGPMGNVAVSTLDAYRAYNYNDEAGGVVKGKKYNVRRAHD